MSIFAVTSSIAHQACEPRVVASASLEKLSHHHRAIGKTVCRREGYRARGNVNGAFAAGFRGGKFLTARIALHCIVLFGT